MSNKYLEVGSNQKTETTYESGGTSEASVANAPKTLVSSETQRQTVNAGQGVADAESSGEARELSKTSELVKTERGTNESSEALIGTEARERVESDEPGENINLTGEKAIVNDTSRELRVSDDTKEGVYVKDANKNTGFSRRKKNIVNTITVNEVKKIVKKEIKKAEGGGGGGLDGVDNIVFGNPNDYLNDDGLNKIIRVVENDGTVKESWIIDKIVTESTLVVCEQHREENGYDYGEDWSVFAEDLGEEQFHEIFGEDCSVEDLMWIYSLYYDQNGEITKGFKFGMDDFSNCGGFNFTKGTPNKTVRVIVGKYFEYDEHGNKVFDEHCVMYSENFVENVGYGEYREITEERQVFELKTALDGYFYFDSDGNELDFGNTRFILYGFEIGEPGSVTYQKHLLEKDDESVDAPDNVEIEKVWLSYDQKNIAIQNYLGGYDTFGKRFVNDSTKIWVNFKTTPISSKVIQEIENGRFVIRLDYPIGKTANHNIKKTVCHSIYTTKTGMGTRGYLYSYRIPDNINTEKKDILLRSLLHINESHIKKNNYGEKYIHYKITLFDYIVRICNAKNVNNLIDVLHPITDVHLTDASDFFPDVIHDHYYMGIPENITAVNTQQFDSLYRGYSKAKFSLMNQYRVFDSISVFTSRGNVSKLNPAFSCYTPLYSNGDVVKIYSPYYVDGSSYKRKQKCFAVVNSVNTRVIVKNDIDDTQYLTCLCYMSARPRCCILNDNYQTADKAFIKKYPQAEQQIRLYCKSVVNLDDYLVFDMPIFRMLITQK